MFVVYTYHDFFSRNHLIVSTAPNIRRPTVAVDLDEVREGAVDRRSNRLDLLPELDSSLAALRNALWCEVKFLLLILAFSLSSHIKIEGKRKNIPYIPPSKDR
jgi:hypothetical protein